MRLYRFKTMAFGLLPLILSCWLLLSVSSLSGALAADGEEASSKSNAASDHTIVNFVDADITAVIDYIKELTGKTFIIDNNVKGKITVISNEKISKQDAYRLFESALEVNGFALVPSGKAIKVVPVAEARTKSIETRVENPQAVSKMKEPEDKLITQLISLTYADVNKVKTLFTSLVSKNSTILAYSDTNTLIITDVESNIKRLLHILDTIDVPGTGHEITPITLTNADAETLSKQLTSIFKTSMSDEKNVSQKTLQFVPDERTNSIIIVASKDDTVRIKELVDILDKDTKGKGKIKVYKLKNAKAEELAETLNNLQKGTSGSSEAGKESVFVSSDINITADKASNSLLIMADGADYAVIEEIIQELDVFRPMVYIEALIMEVSVDKAFELGVEWSAFEDTTIGGDDAVVGGGFNTSDGFAPTSLLTSTGGSVGVVSGSLDLTISGTTYTLPNLGALIKALESNEDIHILQKPKILATDNEESEFIVGKVIPYQTRTSTSDNDTYNSYDYKDVGLTLKITPHISADRYVRLEIDLTLSALPSASTEISTTPTTRNRSIKTPVVVKDQAMLVIGGLIEDTYTNEVMKVPLLGSIPLLGRLFRHDSRVGTKTNLYLFVTPHVLQNQSEADKLTSDVQDTMTPEETNIIKLYGPLESSESSTEPNRTEQPSE